MTVFFLLIGCCIDIGKYLFWSQRYVTPYFLVLSVTLMLFSWLASCAFLAASEASVLEKTRQQSPEYLAQQQRIDSLKNQIVQQERLLEKRLGSSFHSQWKEGQVAIERVAELRHQLAALAESLSDIGHDSVKNIVPTAQFFESIGWLLGVGADWIRWLGFGLLSLLLELSTLGMISLAQTLVREPGLGAGIDSDSQAGNNEECDETRKAASQLSADILQGKIPPVLRKIRAASYGLNLEEIRQVLKGLWEAGLLETDKRNSYQLPSYSTDS